VGVSVCSAKPTFWNKQIPQNSAQQTISCQTSMCMEAYECSVWQRRHFKGRYFRCGILVLEYFLTRTRLPSYPSTCRRPALLVAYPEIPKLCHDKARTKLINADSNQNPNDNYVLSLLRIQCSERLEQPEYCVGDATLPILMRHSSEGTNT
jgi:hypothetical protein